MYLSDLLTFATLEGGGTIITPISQKKKLGQGKVRKIAKQGDGTADVNPQGTGVQYLSL